jgi:hypothetical protein
VLKLPRRTKRLIERLHFHAIPNWRKRQSARTALQDVLINQPIDSASKTPKVVLPPLQEVLTAQPAVLIGLIAHLIG